MTLLWTPLIDLFRSYMRMTMMIMSWTWQAWHMPELRNSRNLRETCSSSEQPHRYCPNLDLRAHKTGLIIIHEKLTWKNQRCHHWGSLVWQRPAWPRRGKGWSSLTPRDIPCTSMGSPQTHWSSATSTWRWMMAEVNIKTHHLWIWWSLLVSFVASHCIASCSSRAT